MQVELLQRMPMDIRLAASAEAKTLAGFYTLQWDVRSVRCPGSKNRTSSANCPEQGMSRGSLGLELGSVVHPKACNTNIAVAWCLARLSDLDTRPAQFKL
ncbi:unnamed protein product [Symbiodinium natans]|uniref:Uncharacterized protein n=1 Tax=Symbiodinium natans TaxID=878477 RepID=A0A812L2C2_9DINO|nr:unnamed protein product [Symbiodinium natans]